MAQKPNIRSFRYSDEVACVLNSYRGENLNEKFENLVLDAFCMVERREAELARVNECIAQRRETLYNLERATEQLAMLERDIKSAQFSFGIVQRRAQSIADAVKEDTP